MSEPKIPDPDPSDNGPRIIVIGTSAGGSEALENLFSRLPPEFGGCLLVVKHLAPYASAVHLVQRLQRRCAIPCITAREGDPLEAGRIHIAPPDHHLLIDENKIWVTRGARENRWRPSIDTLFRSAAVAHRNRVIGVILTGYLDDGVAGLAAIKRCGGITIVQDPVDAEQPDLPLNALDQVEVDHCVPVDQIPALLDRLLATEPGKAPAVPQDLGIEAGIARRAAGAIEEVKAWGKPSAISCPDCGGVMWETDQEENLRFRCHTGHAYSPASLGAAHSQKIEQTLWVALRLFQEKRELLLKLSKDRSGSEWEALRSRVTEIEGYISHVREMLHLDDGADGRQGASLA